MYSCTRATGHAAASAWKGEVRRGVTARLDDVAGIGLVAPPGKESRIEEGDKEESEWMTCGSH
jgi:hypothetical protein